VRNINSRVSIEFLGDKDRDQSRHITTPHGKLMLTVLGGLVEFEHSLIMARTQAGIQRARERGVAFGRPAKAALISRAARRKGDAHQRNAKRPPPTGWRGGGYDAATRLMLTVLAHEGRRFFHRSDATQKGYTKRGTLPEGG
jgi:DNA invertase Pin-like site-specific DNA recombinase